MRIVGRSTILASFFALVQSERAETSEDAPLMQATHLSELSSGDEEVANNLVSKWLPRARFASLLIEDQDLALSREQRALIQSMASPYNVEFTLVEVDEAENLPCCKTSDLSRIFGKAPQGSYTKRHFNREDATKNNWNTYWLLEDKDSALTQEQRAREILLEDFSQEQLVKQRCQVDILRCSKIEEEEEEDKETTEDDSQTDSKLHNGNEDDHMQVPSRRRGKKAPPGPGGHYW